MDLLWRGLVEGLLLIARGDPGLVQVATLSLAISLSATLLSALVGVPAGVALAMGRFPGRAMLHAVVNTGMGLPWLSAWW